MKVVIYDIECYPNILSLVAYIPHLNQTRTYEVSSRKNEYVKLHKFLYDLKSKDYYMVGFNNMGYDYPVLHSILGLHPSTNAKEIVITARRKSKEIIEADFFSRNKHVIYGSRQVIQQIDLFKIWHFDRKAVSLKMLEFVMRQDDIQELPFDPNNRVDESNIDKLLAYNEFDVKNTYEFWLRSKNMVDLRMQMTKYYGKDFLNSSNTKMGSDIMVSELEKVLGDDICYYYKDGERRINRTKRSSIDLSECILPFIEFNSSEFIRIKNYLASQVITETKGVFTELNFKDIDPDIDFKSDKAGRGQSKELVEDWQGYLSSIGSHLLLNADMSPLEYKKQQLATLNTIYKGITYKFGVGGLHGSCSNTTYHSNDEYLIVDLDVTSFYPSLAIEHRFYPEHLSEDYCNVYNDIRQRRVEYKKQGSPFNLALKEALNATYGNSNQEFSPFYDPKYTMMTTINGQLSLCMLIELAHELIDDIQVIQANTDGVTFYINREELSKLDDVVEQWEHKTSLQLENATYKSMFVRDVNNYLAVYEDGKVKNVGAYTWDLLKQGGERWEKDHSALVVPKAVEAFLVYGKCYKQFLREHDDRFDFYLRTKIAKCDTLIGQDVDLEEHEQQRITRYYMSTDGIELMKIMKPLAKKTITKKLRGEWEKLGVGWTLDEEAKILACLKTNEPFTLADITNRPDVDDNFLIAVEYMQPQLRYSSIQKNKLCTIANQAQELVNVDYKFYEKEIEKLITGVGYDSSNI